MTKTDRTHLLRLDGKLADRIDKELKRCRPFLKSRNYFLIELIEIGLNQLDREYKIYGGKRK